MRQIVHLIPTPIIGTVMLTATILLCPVVVGLIVSAAVLRDLPGIARAVRACHDAIARFRKREVRYETGSQNQLIQI